VELSAFPFDHKYAVTGRSLLVFALSSGDRLTRRLRRGIGLIEDALEIPINQE
jgi:glycogen operon protein